MRNTPDLVDFKINIKLKLSFLWTAVMFLYIYGDYFMLYVPGQIHGLMDGNSGFGKTNPIKLLMFAILMSIPPLMIFLSLLLKPKANRLANIFVGSFFTLIMIMILFTSIDTWLIFSSFLSVVEIIFTSLVVGYAWKWPGQEASAAAPSVDEYK